MVDRILSASSSAEYKKILEVVKSNTGRITENWAHEASRSAYLKGADLNVPEETRVERLKLFYEALMERAENPSSKKGTEMLRSAIRSEQARGTGLSNLVKKQMLLRDTMMYVVEHDLPEMPKATAKLALDAIVDRSIELIVTTMDEYAELRSSLSTYLPGEDEESSMDQVLARFCKSAMDFFDADFTGLFRYSPQVNSLVCQACSAKGVSLSKGSAITLDSFPVAAEAIAHRKTNYLGNGADPKRKKVLGRLTFSHSVCVPMLREEQIVGVFMIGDSSKLVQLTSDEVGLTEDLAMQLSRFLEDTERVKALDLRSNAQKVLIETAASLQTEIESEEIYRIVATRLTELVPCDELSFYVFDWERRVANPVFATGPYAREIMEDRDFPCESGIVGYVAKSRKGEIIWDTERDPRGEQIPGTPHNPTRMLAVPVVGQKEVLGVIELQKYPPSSFTQEDLEIATLFANHASVALENAKLVKELTRVRDQIELHMDLLTHDIANYATPIMAYFESLRKRQDLDPQVATVVERTTRQAESIMRLIEMVRTMSRLRDPTPKSLKRMDLRKAIELAIADSAKYGDSGKMKFELKLPDEAMLVLGDELLKDIFVNLFYSIAMSEQKEGSALQVSVEERVERKMAFWWVKVSQPNRAIPPHLKGEVLRMAKVSRSELAGSFGIGLAAAKGIVDRYSGSMWVGDIVPGDYSKGCVFNMLLPKAL